MTWIHDVVLSYLAGIGLGAPVGLLAIWITGRPEALTGVILAMMGTILLARRLARRRRTSAAPASAAATAA
jgi:hypothetical protein